MTQTIKDPASFAKLPAGTRVLWGQVGDATADLKLLPNAMAIGATGEKSGFVDATRLIDTSEKSIADLAKGPEKEFAFLDDPTDVEQNAFLAAAAAKQAVKIRIEFPNTRWADTIVALGGWEMAELDKGQPMRVVVSGKQNSISRGVTTPAP